jgi:hypothetical protein
VPIPIKRHSAGYSILTIWQRIDMTERLPPPSRFSNKGGHFSRIELVRRSCYGKRETRHSHSPSQPWFVSRERVRAARHVSCVRYSIRTTSLTSSPKPWALMTLPVLEATWVSVLHASREEECCPDPQIQEEHTYLLYSSGHLIYTTRSRYMFHISRFSYTLPVHMFYPVATQ